MLLFNKLFDTTINKIYPQELIQLFGGIDNFLKIDEIECDISDPDNIKIEAFKGKKLF